MQQAFPKAFKRVKDSSFYFRVFLGFSMKIKALVLKSWTVMSLKITHLPPCCVALDIPRSPTGRVNSGIFPQHEMRPAQATEFKP